MLGDFQRESFHLACFPFGRKTVLFEEAPHGNRSRALVAIHKNMMRRQRMKDYRRFLQHAWKLLFAKNNQKGALHRRG
jgi:hypothetical protein